VLFYVGRSERTRSVIEGFESLTFVNTISLV
jgi:hypothetical protein